MFDVYKTMYVSHIEAKWRIYASGNYTIIDSDSDLSPVRRKPLSEPVMEHCW